MQTNQNTGTDILAALSIAKTGTVFDLALEFGGPRYNSLPSYSVPFRQFRSFSGTGSPDIQICNEVIKASIHQGTHIDGLAHFQESGLVYGGATTEESWNESGWIQLGAETIAPMIRRGVMIDLIGQKGSPQTNGQITGLQEIKSRSEAQGIVFKDGDAVLIRTGKTETFSGDSEGDWSVGPGISREAGAWLCDQGAAVIGIDSPSIDAIPFEDWGDLAHVEILIRRGVYIVENLYLKDLASANTKDFLFLCSPLKFLGSSGAWVRPIAIT